MVLKAHSLLHVVDYPEGPMTGVFVPLVPVAQCSMVSKALSHSGSFHQQDFVYLKTASRHGED